MERPARPPDELLRAVRADLRPVRPLPPPSRRALWLGLWIPVALAAVAGPIGLRPDAASIGGSLLCGSAGLQAALGLGLAGVALSVALPARGPARSVAVVLAAAAAILWGAHSWVGSRLVPGISVADPWRSHGPACFALQLALGLTALAALAVLVVRSAPLRAGLSGTLGGAGAGILAAGVYQLHCPVSDLRHVLPWHGGAVLALALVGLAGGLLWERRGARERARALGGGGTCSPVSSGPDDRRLP